MDKVVFTFDCMIASLRSSMATFPDKRKGTNTQYEVMDAASAAFSVFFTQSPSFLEYQKLMQEKYSLSNCQTIFGVKRIPSDNQIRNLLDNIPPSFLSPVFEDCFNALKKSHDLDIFRVKLGKDATDKDVSNLLIALDGTQYFS